MTRSEMIKIIRSDRQYRKYKDSPDDVVLHYFLEANPIYKDLLEEEAVKIYEAPPSAQTRIRELQELDPNPLIGWVKRWKLSEVNKTLELGQKIAQKLVMLEDLQRQQATSAYQTSTAREKAILNEELERALTHNKISIAGKATEASVPADRYADIMLELLRMSLLLEQKQHEVEMQIFEKHAHTKHVYELNQLELGSLFTALNQTVERIGTLEVDVFEIESSKRPAALKASMVEMKQREIEIHRRHYDFSLSRLPVPQADGQEPRRAGEEDSPARTPNRKKRTRDRE